MITGYPAVGPEMPQSSATAESSTPAVTTTPSVEDDQTTSTVTSVPDMDETAIAIPVLGILWKMRELTGYGLKRGNVTIDKLAYENSIEMGCRSWGGGGTVRYDVSVYKQLMATLGFPSDVGDMYGASCLITITKEPDGKQLARYELAAASPPINLDVPLEDVAQVQINSTPKLPNSVRYVYVAFGSAKVS